MWRQDTRWGGYDRIPRSNTGRTFYQRLDVRASVVDLWCLLVQFLCLVGGSFTAPGWWDVNRIGVRGGGAGGWHVPPPGPQIFFNKNTKEMKIARNCDREQPFAEEFSEMGWVEGVVSSVSCQASLHLSGMKDDFVWTGSAGKRTSCGIVGYFISAEFRLL